MQAQAKRIIDIANNLNTVVTLRDGYGYLGQNVYLIKYTVKDKVAMCDEASFALYEDYIQFLPNGHTSWGLNFDKRKKKKFHFADYNTIECLVIDLIKYIEDCVYNFYKEHGMVKQIQKRIDRRVIKILMKSAQ